MENFFDQYFIKPIIEHSGYNIVNTFIYAIIAISIAYILYKILKKRFTRRFLIYLIPFILLGSTIRVITDSIDNGVAQKSNFGIIKFIVSTGIYNYGFLTASPGIYFIIFAIVLISLYLSEIFKNEKILPIIGLLLLVPHFSILILLIKNLIYVFLPVVVILISLPLFYFLKRFKIDNIQSKIAIFSHSFDGFISFFAIEIFNRISPECIEFGRCYAGQHVVERFFTNLFPFGTIIFFLIKVAVVSLFCYLIEREIKGKRNENGRNFLYTLVIVFGLAPGVRNFLRLLIGA